MSSHPEIWLLGPGKQLRKLNGGGGCLHIEDYDLVNRKLKTFLLKAQQKVGRLAYYTELDD